MTRSTPAQIASVITRISHDAFASGMRAAFLVAAAAAISETTWTGVVAFETRNADVRSGLDHLAQQLAHLVPA